MSYFITTMNSTINELTAIERYYHDMGVEIFIDTEIVVASKYSVNKFVNKFGGIPAVDKLNLFVLLDKKIDVNKKKAEVAMYSSLRADKFANIYLIKKYEHIVNSASNFLENFNEKQKQ